MDRVKNTIIKEIVRTCKQYGADKVVLFGSRAKNTACERSDIDIAVSGVGDIDELEEALWQIPTLYKIDLVDLDNCKNELLLEDIATYGREISEEV